MQIHEKRFGMRLRIVNLMRWVAALAICGMAFLHGDALYSEEVKTVNFNPSDRAVARSSPMLIGVNVHYGLFHILGYFSAATGVQEISAIGVTSIRDFFGWQSFTFTPTEQKLIGSLRLLDFLKVQATKPMLNLGLANSHVPGGIPPVSDEGLVYFQRYLDAVVAVTRQFDPIYEIWNEWNVGTGTGQKMPRMVGAGEPDDPRAAINYVRIAKVAVQKIRAIDPKATIIVGAVGDDLHDWEWTQGIVRGGALDHADGLSVHLYNHCMRPPNRTATEMIDRVTQLQTILRKLRGTGDTPIYITEFGWPTSNESCHMTPEASAPNFAQFILQSAAIPWIKGIWIHELKNNGPDPKNRENNFGLYTYDDQPKLAACFVTEATKIVKDAKSIEIRRPFPDVFVVRARMADRQKIVLWTSSAFVSARYALPRGREAGHIMCASTESAVALQGKLGPEPLVFDFDAPASIQIEVGR